MDKLLYLLKLNLFSKIPVFLNTLLTMGKNELQPENWVDRYADYLFNFTRVRVGDDDVAKDLVQETFISGLKASERFKGQAAERTWLVAILKRKIIDHYRKSNSLKGKTEVRMSYPVHGDQEGDWLEAQAADPESIRENDRIENNELGVAIQNCISMLPEKHARVFTLKTVQGWSTEDVCNELEITSSNLWVMIHRARTSLMECMNEHWFKNT
jgi:RNA polymerase sigma-70 factor (TIGR02943 family)